ncbi:AAA family ATPase [Dokdonella immobilis]|uniref:AAA domain-containing protein n=1 Tax=Dokdonella immobilis TaxID=578942 RepID=A0A1I4ZUL6_9GAMM|nr:AAA family ATPase [Dokdonella immobilis]SFN53857.1 AAA domain-containing protein [Dokdonella immobilis]
MNALPELPRSIREVDERAERDLRRMEQAADREPHDDAWRPTVTLRRAADIPCVPIRWLWPGWLARGKLHLLAGAPGVGKSTLGMALAAAVSSGGRWPSGSSAPTGSVLIWSGEDDPGDTLIPRLRAAGANLDRVFFVGDVADAEGVRYFDPARDVQALSIEADRIGNVSLIVADPVVSAVAGDSHKNTEVRRALQPLVELADRIGAAILGITHFSKGSQGRDPTERVVGSIAFGALARVVLVAAKSAEGEDGPPRMLARAKSNIGPDGGGFGYDLEQVDIGQGMQASMVRWGATLDGSARELLGAAEEVMGDVADAITSAEQFLRQILADGPVPAKQVKSDAGNAGVAWASVRRAKTRLGVITRKDGGHFGEGPQQWLWELSDDPETLKVLKNPEGAQQKNVSTFSKVEHLQAEQAEWEDDE